MSSFDPMSVPAIWDMSVKDGSYVLEYGPRTWAEIVWLRLYEQNEGTVRLNYACRCLHVAICDAWQPVFDWIDDWIDKMLALAQAMEEA